MIKLGSRTELILPDEPGLRVEVNVGDRVRAGRSIVARRTKSETRNPKSETSPNDQEQKLREHSAGNLLHSDFRRWICFGFRVPHFGLPYPEGS